MSKIALVLSGGGAKGAFQFMAEKYAREIKGYKWDIIAGVSVGAVNGTMLAMEKYDRLEQIWENISSDQVYRGKMNFWSIVKLTFGAKSIYDNGPLWKMIDQEIDPSKIKIDLRIGVVSLRTGKYARFTPTDYGFKKAVLASTAIPLIWAPVDVSPSHVDMVDGGVRNVSPVGDILDEDPDEVVIINCNPRQMPKSDEPVKNALDIGKLVIETAMNEILITDVREFVRINRNVLEAQKSGVTLHNENGKEYKYYKSSIIEPDEPLGDTLDFSRDVIEKRMKAGWNKAKEILGP